VIDDMDIDRKREANLAETSGWFDKVWKSAAACDKFVNCAYVKKQLEEEWRQEVEHRNSAVERVWNRLDRSVEVELYRQFLFEENSVAHTVDVDEPSPQPLAPPSTVTTPQNKIPGLVRTNS